MREGRCLVCVSVGVRESEGAWNTEWLVVYCFSSKQEGEKEDIKVSRVSSSFTNLPLRLLGRGVAAMAMLLLTLASVYENIEGNKRLHFHPKKKKKGKRGEEHTVGRHCLCFHPILL